MKKQGAGVIINISSIGALRGAPYYPVYSATKAALIGLTKSLAQQLGPHRIRVNCICPGSIGGTQLLIRSRGYGLSYEERLNLLKRIPLRRSGRPEEIASLVLFLASEDAAFLNGAVIVIDGGEYGGGWMI
jgi:NAD(P)-dependent dehydrogenase (short-subunit alcohol dehydrogenase family)